MSSIDQIASELLSAATSKNPGAAKSAVDKLIPELKDPHMLMDKAKEAAKEEAKEQASNLAEGGKDAAKSYADAKAQEHLGTDLNTLESFVPENFSEDELTEKLKLIINEIGAKGPEDVGKVCAIANTVLDNKEEIKNTAKVASKLLS